MKTKTTVTIRRPDGTEEMIDVTSRFPIGISEPLFARMRQENRKAGRGELLRHEHIVETTPAEDARRVVDKLFDRAEDLRDNSARYFPARQAAEKALADWRTAYPEDAAAIDREIAAERARKDEEHAPAVARALKLED